MMTNCFLPIGACLLVSVFLIGCKEKQPVLKQPKAIEHMHLPEPKSWQANIQYRLDSLPDKPAIDSFFKRYKKEDLDVILALNHIDKRLVKKGQDLVVPSMIFPSYADYCTLPVRFREADTLEKFILVSLRTQCFGLYESGFLVRCGPVSTGKQAAPTPAGKYHTNWKKDVKISTIDPDWVMPWYFNIENKQGIAFHKYELPGYPASHACIRLREEDATWIYKWADKWVLGDSGRKVLKNGTPVVIFGAYDFNDVPVWKKLPGNPKAMALTDEEMNEIRELMKHPGKNKVEAPEAGAP